MVKGADAEADLMAKNVSAPTVEKHIQALGFRHQPGRAEAAANLYFVGEDRSSSRRREADCNRPNSTSNSLHHRAR